MKAELERKLAELKGKELKDQFVRVVIGDYKISSASGTVFIYVNGSPKNMLFSQALIYLNSLEPVTELPEKVIGTHPATPIKQVSEEHVALHTQIKKDNQLIKDALMDTIKRLKEDKEYIEQAKATCNVVSQYINLQKNEIRIAEILHS